MDSKTKALLHQSGAVLASDGTHQGAVTQFTVFPPAMSYAVTNDFFNHPNTDVEHAISQIAVSLGNAVSNAVQEQMLKAYKLDSKGALKNVYEAKAKWAAEKGYHTFSPENPLSGTWSMYPVADVTVEDCIEAMLEKMKKLSFGTPDLGGILTIPEGDIWDPTVYAGEWPGHSHYDATIPYEPQEARVYDRTEIFHRMIPGFSTMRQACPVKECAFHKQENMFLQTTIIHLNDRHEWTREEVADWLETLDHDLTLLTPEEVKDDHTD